MFRRLISTILFASLSLATAWVIFNFQNKREKRKVFRLFKSLFSENGPKSYVNGNDVNIIKVDFRKKPLFDQDKESD
jgi:hypothetical protein